MRQIVKDWHDADRQLHEHSTRGTSFELLVGTKDRFFTVRSIRHIDNGVRFELGSSRGTVVFVETTHGSDEVTISIHSNNDRP